VINADGSRAIGGSVKDGEEPREKVREASLFLLQEKKNF
jgi:hypothetical protein